MKRFLTPLILTLLSMPTLVKAQCTSTISAPVVAISNCIGPNVSVSVSTPGPYSVMWSSGTATFGSSSSMTTTVSASGPGPQTITVLTIDGAACTSTDTFTIQFIAPVDSFNISLCPLPDTICPLQCPISSLLGWSYIDSSGASTSLPTAALNCVSVTQPGTYRLLAIYETNCTVQHDYLVTDCSASCDLDLGPDAWYCNYITYPLNAVASPPGAGWTYSWDNPTNLNTTTSASPLFYSTTTGDFQYIVTATNTTLGCTAVDTLNIHVFGYTDTIMVYSCVYPATICPVADSMVMSFISWSPAGTVVGNCNTVATSGVYTFNGVYSGGCTVSHKYNLIDTCGACSVDLGPDILAISNCTGPVLSANAVGSGSFTYSWTGSANVTFNTPTSASPYVSAAGPGIEIITLTVTDSLGCVASDNMNITFYHPTDTFYVYTCGFNDSLCILDIDIPFGSPSWTYIDSTGGSTPVGNTDCIAATQNGTYQMFAVYETNCTVIHKYIVLDTCWTSIYEHASLVEAGLYPNPATDQLTIITDEPLTNLVIWDATGRQVMTKVNYQHNNTFTFPITNLLNGSYVVRIQTGKGFVNKRLVKINK